MPQSIYKKLNLDEENFKNLLKNKYSIGLSQAKIAQELDCDITVIERYFKKYNLITRNLKDAAILNIKRIILTYIEKEIIEGWLLSDGCLSKGRKSARFTFGLKYKNPIVNLIQLLPSFKFTPIWQSKKTNCFHIKTHSYLELLELYSIWYPLDKKTIPLNFVLTPVKAYYWFIGDGHKTKYGITLNTEGFDDISISKLSEQLNLINVNHSILKNKRIRIKSASVTNFLSFIGPCFDNDYLYKWEN